MVEVGAQVVEAEAEPAVGCSPNSAPALVEAARAASDEAGALEDAIGAASDEAGALEEGAGVASDDAGAVEEAALVSASVLLISLALELTLDVAVIGSVDIHFDETSTTEEVELAPGVVLEEGEGWLPPVPGTTFFFKVKSAWVTSSADSC